MSINMLPTSLISQIAQISWTPLCFTNTVPRLQMKEIDLEYRKVGVFQTSDDEFLALDDRCPHRHGSLCGQRIDRDGTLSCPYHGAKFNTTSGKCIDFLNAPSSLRLHKYETKVDQDNVLWCKLTDDAVPFPELPYYIGENERAVRGTTDVSVSAFDLIETLCDPIHIHEVHTFGNKDDPQSKNVKKLVTSPISCGYTYSYNSSALLTKNSNDVVHVVNGFYGPFFSVLERRLLLQHEKHPRERTSADVDYVAHVLDAGARFHVARSGGCGCTPNYAKHHCGRCCRSRQDVAKETWWKKPGTDKLRLDYRHVQVECYRKLSF